MKRFTLLELLIVIAIVGILVSLLLPSLSKARITGYSAVSKSNLRGLHMAFLDYSQENDDRFPRYRISTTRSVCFWTRELKSYFGDAHSIMKMPGVSYLSGQWSGYSASFAIMGFSDRHRLEDKYSGRKINTIANPTETYLLFEGVAGTGYNAEGRVSWSQVQTDKSAASSDVTRSLNFYYNEKMNWVNVDGAVSSLHFKSRRKITENNWQGL